MAEPTPEQQQNIATAMVEVSERLSVLVREEIELAKAEMITKSKRLAVGVAAGVVAGVFVLLALLYGLEGLGWLIWYKIWAGTHPNFFWGFLTLAALLVLAGGAAGYLTIRVLRRAVPPTPNLAIEEARRIRETVTSGTGGTS